MTQRRPRGDKISRVKAIVPLLVFAAVSANGSTIIESSTCTIPGTSVTTTNGCSVGTAPPAAAGVAFSTTVGVGEFSGIIAVDANVVAPDEAGSASASLSFLDELYTSGPVRPGLMAITFGGGYADNGEYDGSGSAQIGPWCGFSIGSVAPSGDCGLPGDGFIPVELGTQFALQATMGGYARSTQAGGGGSVGVSLNFSIEFFEADGVTSVPLLEATPEPSALLLCSVGLGLLPLIRALRSPCRERNN
jgi:hypothetical protein